MFSLGDGIREALKMLGCVSREEEKPPIKDQRTEFVVMECFTTMASYLRACFDGSSKEGNSDAKTVTDKQIKKL